MMKLALLYAVAKRDLSIEEKGVMEMTEQLLQEQLAQNLYFAFYQQMPEEIRYRFHFTTGSLWNTGQTQVSVWWFTIRRVNPMWMKI